MDIQDVKNRPKRERRICRANLRLYPSQMNFIDEHDLSVQAIFDKALHELGHKAPAPGDVEKFERAYGNPETGRSRGNSKIPGRGNIRRKRVRHG